MSIFSALAQLNQTNISYPLLFLIGLLSSLHCVGMCGGIVAAYCNANPDPKAHWQYNLGRLISYTTIGALLGGFGSVFLPSPTITGLITLVAGLIMVLYGLEQLLARPFLSKITLPWSRFFKVFGQSKSSAPFFVGLANGLMPCGPLQTLQLYALSSGSAIRGGLSLGIYALGTIPLMLGFGHFLARLSRSQVSKALRISGVIIIILGLLLLGRAWESLKGRPNQNPIQSRQTESSQSVQTVQMDLTFGGYLPNTLRVKKGVPVRWIINVKQMSGCTNEILLPEYNIRRKLNYGENVIEFTPTKVGESAFSCWMRMVWGKFVVYE